MCSTLKRSEGPGELDASYGRRARQCKLKITD